MKNAIREYIELTDKEKKELWDKATFVFDTNVLLNLYRYSKNTQDTLFSAMEELKDRIWIPHQVAEEFMRNRIEIIFEVEQNYSNLKRETLESCRNNMRIDENDEDYKGFENIINEWINKRKEKNLLVTNPNDDIILSKILELFDSKAGSPYNDEVLKQTQKEGEYRYKNNVPPGYRDSNKRNGNEFGDYIVWKQILDYSEANGKDIILVTNDNKEDWWNKPKGKTIGPRPELRKEFFEKTSMQFHMYNMKQFINVYKEKMNKEIDDSVIDEVTKDEEKNSFSLKDPYPYSKMGLASFSGNSNAFDTLKAANLAWSDIKTPSISIPEIAKLNFSNFNNSIGDALKNISLVNYQSALKNFNNSYYPLNTRLYPYFDNVFSKANDFNVLDSGKSRDIEEYEQTENKDDKE